MQRLEFERLNGNVLPEGHHEVVLVHHLGRLEKAIVLGERTVSEGWLTVSVLD